MLRGTLIVGIGTLFSRILGMLRDMATAATLGMSVDGVMDSFVVAFRLPDVARRLFGDGALGIGFIPVFGRLWATDRQKAWTLLSVALGWVFLFLTGFVLIGEFCCWIGFTYFHPDSRVYLISHLLALLLPYLILICMAAIASATLQMLGRFEIPAMIPPILSIIWLFGILVAAPYFSDDPTDQCYLLTICILIAGVIQFFIHFPILRAYGFRFDFRPRLVRPEVAEVFRGFFPQLFSLMSLQLNILAASGVAWLFSGPPDQIVAWLGDFVHYPLRPGAASAIYYSERLYEFPQGLIGLALATAIYPLLAQHAARKNFKSLGEDLTLGLRIQFVFSIPAGIGLMLFSEKLAHLLFQRGAFTPSDMARTADMIFWFGTGVWAFCALPILIRAFYVLGDTRTPFRVGVLCCLLNIVFALAFIWPFGEEGLAIAASLAAGVQSLLLLGLFVLRHGHINHRGILVSIFRAGIASGLMAICVLTVMSTIPGQDSVSDIIHLILGGSVGIFVFLFVHRFLGGRELGILVRGRLRKTSPGKPNSRRRS